MTDDRLTEVLQSMGPEVGPATTEKALAEVHDQSRIRRRHQTRVRAAIGVAAALSVIFGGVALANRAGDGQPVVADQPATTTSSTNTTLAPWIVTTSIPDPGPAAGIPPPLHNDQLDDVVGVELRTWLFDDQTDGFWAAEPAQVEAIVAALKAGGETFLRPEYIDHAYVRFALADGNHALLDMDVESGWIEPDRRLPEELTHQIRDGLNEVVAHPWQGVDLQDPQQHINRVIGLTSQPWSSPEAARDGLLAAFEQDRYADYERWYGEVRREEGTAFVEVRWRGLGDDSARGFDYRFWLVERADGWHLDTALERGLCLRSPSTWHEDAGNWSCL